MYVDVTGVLMCAFFFQAEDGIRGGTVTGVQTYALPICPPADSWTWWQARSTAWSRPRPAICGWTARHGRRPPEIGRASWRERGGLPAEASSPKENGRESCKEVTAAVAVSDAVVTPVDLL